MLSAEMLCGAELVHARRIEVVRDARLRLTDSLPRSDVMRSMLRSRSFFSSCCHKRTTCQPRLRSFRKLLRSRSRFRLILARQNGWSRRAHAGNLYPCQKSPSMKTAIFWRVRTRSGQPGRSLRCFLKRKPRRWSSDLTNRSRSVSFCRTLAISALL